MPSDLGQHCTGKKAAWTLVGFLDGVSSAHLLDAAVVNEAGIGAGASDDEPRPEQLGRQLHLVVVYESCCRLQAKERRRRRQVEEEGERERQEGK